MDKVEEEVERLQESEVERLQGLEATVSSGHNRMDAHMNSGRLWKQTHGLHRFNLDWVLEMRERKGHGLLLLFKKLSVMCTQW